MGFSLSPTVTVREFDKTLTVPGLATSIAAAVGHFQWGPVGQIELVDSEQTLIEKFGEPDDEHYADWFPSANFLAYSNNLQQVRVARNDVEDFTGLNADLTYTATGGTITTVGGDFTTSFKVGDTFILTGSASNDGVYVVEAVTTNTLTVVGDLVLDEGTADAPGYFTIGAFNAVGEVASINTDGSETEAAVSVSIAPAYIPNIEALEEMGSHVAKTAVYARCPGEFGNRLSVHVINGVFVDALADNWTSWEFKNFFDYAPTGDEIYVVVELDSDVVEIFQGSQDSASVSPLGGTDYFVELINRTSKYIMMAAPGDDYGLSHQTDGAGNTKAYTGTLDSGYTVVPVNFSQQLSGGITSAPVLGDYQRGWDLFADPETSDANFLLQGGAGTEVGKYITENIAEVRLDCVACVSPNEDDVVGVPSPTTSITALRGPGQDLSFSSSYAVIDGNYKRQYDKYNDVYRWVPFNGDIAGLMARTDDLRDPWWSPAGLNRGQIKNVYKVAFNPSKTQRDELYRVGINPIAQFRGEGTVLYGDKTAQTKPSAFDRINVRRLFITIEKAIATASRYQLFEFNDEVTRNNFLNLVEPYLRNVQGRRGIQEFRVVCDETNNTPTVIDRNEFVGDIYVKPNRSINEIQLNFIAVATGVKFEEVILNPEQ